MRVKRTRYAQGSQSSLMTGERLQRNIGVNRRRRRRRPSATTNEAQDSIIFFR